MNTKTLLAAALFVSAAGLSAIGINASADDHVAAVKTDAASNAAVSGKTRTQVKAELAQAYRAGWRPPTDYEISAIEPWAPRVDHGSESQ